MRVQEDSFAMTYLSSSDFCPSSKQVWALKKRHEDDAGDVLWIGMVYSWTGRICVALLTSVICYQIFTRFEYFKTELNSPLLPTIVNFLNLLDCFFARYGCVDFDYEFVFYRL